MTWNDIARLFAALELELIQSFKRNLEKHRTWEKQEGFDWPAWQEEKLRQMEAYRKRNRQTVYQYRVSMDAETRTMLAEQFAEGERMVEREILEDQATPGRDGFFGVNDRRLDSLSNDMLTVEHRVQEAALRTMDDVYRKTLYKAELAMAAGATTLPKAIDMAAKEFLAKGINCIGYKDGRRVNIADYAQMALRTAAIRSYLQGEGKRRAELGIDTVLVSQYGACSETCLPWQGRVYIDDVWGGFAGETEGTRGKSRNGRWYPLLSGAIAGGLFHPNCRHTLSAWVEGSSRLPPPMDKEMIRRTAKLEQKQRQLEREVRSWKRLAEGSVDPQNQAMYSQRVKQGQKELREFVGGHSDVLRRDYWREKIYGQSAPFLMRLNYTDNVPETERSSIEQETSIIPDKLRDLAESQITSVRMMPDSFGGSGYDPKTNTLFIVSNRTKGSVIHEYAHAIEKALDLYNNPEFLTIRDSGLENITLADIIEDNETFTKPIIRLKANKLVSLYQGCLYQRFGIYDGKNISLNGMREYFSEGFRTYYTETALLKERDPKLFDFIGGLQK